MNERSDSTETPLSARPDYAAFIEQLHADGSKPACPMCGANNWLGLGEATDMNVLALLALSGAGRIEPGAGMYRVVGLACAKCRFVRLHTLDVGVG